jgi:3,4-dihydroxy 2-butanone 4-phosphate synthase/GTP cyclohydrolase II
MEHTRVGHFVSAQEAARQLARGDMLILIDNEERENEGDFVIAAEHVTAEAVNLMVTRGRGLVCAPLTAERARELGLGLQAENNTALHGTNFTVSVDAVEGTTSGISTADRAQTIRVLADEDARPEDLGRPGHIFPIVSATGGVTERAGHTEAIVDLLRIGGGKPVGVLCEILNDDGSMARLPELMDLAEELGMSIARVDDVVRYRAQQHGRQQQSRKE